MSNHPRWRLPFLLVALWLHAGAVGAATTPVVQVGDASVSHDEAARTWSISAGGATLTLGLDPSHDFEVLALTTAGGQSWTSGTASADSTVTAGGTALAFGSRKAGFTFQSAAASSDAQSVSLIATFVLKAHSLRVSRHYTAVSGSPTFQTWTTFEALEAGAVPDTSNLSGLQITVPAGAIHWLTGLQGDNADVAHDSAFTLEQKTLDVGEQLSLGAQGRSSEQTVPWFAIDGSQSEFYAGLMWSGAWSLTLTRADAGLTLSFGLAPMTTSVPVSVDGPHVIFGVADGGLPDASAALRDYIVQGLRGGRPFTPLVTYNTWFAYGVSIDERSMRAEMDHAAKLGTELFVIDAGWYAGVGANGPFDFDSGLGSWQADPKRFPDGLKPLADYAHSFGMKFGIWVEPERVNLETADDSGVSESWLATEGGNYGSSNAAQICLAGAAGRQWVFDHLTAFLDAVQPDYLKWDNNMWVNCDRPGHGHGATDGSFAHVNGLYSILSQLRARYPDLLIENVSGGGNRLDFGMLQYSDVAWMDDRTAPSVHVRHNVQGLSAAFPPAYLLSFVTDHSEEPIHDAPDLSLYFRSRMEGALGLCFRGASLSFDDETSIAHEVAIYKTMRATLSLAAGALLTPQAAAENGPAWDVLQETHATGADTLLYAFQSDSGVESVNVRPTGLDPQTQYEVRSVDAGLLGTASGADLMANGIDLVQSPATAAHVLILSVKQP